MNSDLSPPPRFRCVAQEWSLVESSLACARVMSFSFSVTVVVPRRKIHLTLLPPQLVARLCLPSELRSYSISLMLRQGRRPSYSLEVTMMRVCETSFARKSPKSRVLVHSSLLISSDASKVGFLHSDTYCHFWVNCLGTSIVSDSFDVKSYRRQESCGN